MLFRDLEDNLDLPEADAGGESDRGELAELGGIAQNGVLDEALGLVELLAECVILGLEPVNLGLASRRVESLLNLAGVLIDGLPTTADLLSLAGNSPKDARQDGGGIAVAGANG